MDPEQRKREFRLFLRRNARKGFGIVEVMVSAVVLGFMCVALNKLQTSNHDTFIRIRGRDGAVEVAQRVLDSLSSVGASSIVSKSNSDTVLFLNDVSLQWDRGLGGHVSVAYTPRVTVRSTDGYVSTAHSNYEDVSHIYAKQIEVQVDWNYKGSVQSISVSRVVR